jgi:hypothetical protein
MPSIWRACSVQDLRSTIIPRSDQFNSEQLLGGPMIITVTDVRAGGGEEQPVSIFYDADPGRPYKPCKTMRKVLILAWGPDGTQWIGKSMELYCEPSVKFGGEVVGGIRISRLSDIPKDIKVSLTATKGRKAMHEIGLLKRRRADGGLAAIAAATGRESLQKARALAEALTADADIALARTAYAKKVAKAQAASVIDPSDRPDTGAEEHAAEKPQRKEPQEHPAAEDQTAMPRVTYATLANRITKKGVTRDVAELVLDEGRALPADQQAELLRLFNDRFPE